MRFLKSFQYAFRGLVYCINNERNMRVHSVAAFYVLLLSLFFDLSRTRYAVLFLTISAVMTAELFNTVAEELSDLTAASFHPVVRIIKDLAAGGVLVAALAAAAVGVCFFWQPEKLRLAFLFFATRPPLLALLLASFAASAVYVAAGPIGIRDFIRKRKERRGDLH